MNTNRCFFVVALMTLCVALATAGHTSPLSALRTTMNAETPKQNLERPMRHAKHQPVQEDKKEMIQSEQTEPESVVVERQSSEFSNWQRVPISEKTVENTPTLIRPTHLNTMLEQNMKNKAPDDDDDDFQPGQFMPTQSMNIDMASCGDGFCDPADGCCHDDSMGAVCFATSTHTCADDRLLCPLESPNACGLACYSEDEYDCDANENLISLLNVAQSASAGHTCAATECTEGDDCCHDPEFGPTCYDTSTHTCTSTSVICPLQAPESCDIACFHPDEYACYNGELFEVNDNTQFVQNEPTVDTTFVQNEPTAFDNDDDSTRFVQNEPSVDTTFVQNEPLAFDTADPEEVYGTDVSQTLGRCDANSICGGNDQCCSDQELGAVCFNPSTHVCAPGDLVCPLESPNACGLACFSQDQYRCAPDLTLQWIGN